jgi:hypothetical protein
MLLLELLFEYDITKLPPRFLGYKAFEIAYNKVLTQGLLTGTALPLEMVFNSMEKHPGKDFKLLKSKGGYKFYVPNSFRNVSNAFAGEGHDLLHLLTGNAPMNFATKTDKFNKVKPSVKNIKQVIKDYGNEIGFDLLNWVNKNIPNYNSKTDLDTIKSKLISNKETNGVLFDDLLKFFTSVVRETEYPTNQFGKTHYQTPSKTKYKENWGLFKPGDYGRDLSQYSAEEIAGNSVLLNSAGDFESMGHLPIAVFNSKLITDKQLNEILRDLVYNMGQFYTREDSKDDPRIGPMMEKWKNYMLKLLPVFVKEYNQALKVLSSSSRSS